MEFNTPSPLRITSNLPPQNFKFFKQEVGIYMTATKTDTESKEVQKARLLNLIRSEACNKCKLINHFSNQCKSKLDSVLKI